MNRKLFHQVRIDPEAHTLVWANGAGFDPAMLHHWPAVAEEIEAMARRRESMESEPFGRTG
jgi:hypothetical protein